jgi:tetratricopeptide (TPR) repeat protein
MSKREDLLREARELIAQAKVDAALSLLNTQAGDAGASPSDRSWRDAITALQSRLETLEQREDQQLIAPDEGARERSQIVHAALNVIEKMEGQQAAPATASFTRERAVQTNRWLQWALIGTLLIAAAVLGIWWLNRATPPAAADAATDTSPLVCPEFPAEAEFNILILPFRPYRGEPSRAHYAIGDRLGQEVAKYDLAASIRPVDLPYSDINPYPVAALEARRLAKGCGAQLIIWGNTEPHPDGPSAGEIVRTDFAFVESDNFDFTLLDLDETASVATVSTLSSIVSSGQLTRSIEYNIQLLLGLIAHESEQYAQAIEILEDLPVDEADPTASTLQRMILADTYLRQEEYDRARTVYEQVVDLIPDYTLARNNLAMLYYREEAFDSAARQLDTLAQLQPTDKEVARRQILANIKSGDLYKVQPLVERATLGEDTSQLPVRSAAVPQITQEYERKEQELQREQQAADRVLRTDPDNVGALETKARTAKKLGDFTTAKRVTDRLQRIDPANRLVPELRDTVRLQLPERNIRRAPAVNLERDGNRR